MVSMREFQNPPAKYRIKPFWFWNGEMTKEEICLQIRGERPWRYVYLCKAGNDGSLSFQRMV